MLASCLESVKRDVYVFSNVRILGRESNIAGGVESREFLDSAS